MLVERKFLSQHRLGRLTQAVFRQGFKRRVRANAIKII